MMGFPDGASSKEHPPTPPPPTTAGDVGDASLLPGLRRSPGGGFGNLLQCSCLENHQGQRSLAGFSP